VKLLLSEPPDTDHLLLTQLLRREAGRAKMPFRVVKPEPNEAGFSNKLSKAIRGALVGEALIVKLDDDPALIKLLDDASARGVKILSLDRPLPTRGDKAHPWITYDSFTRAGHQIVETVVEAAKVLKSTTQDRIVVIENRTPHRYKAERIASLVDALKTAGRAYATVSFEGDVDAAAKALEQSLSTGPKVAIVLAEEDVGLFGAQRKSVERLEQNQPTFILGGYFAYDFRTADNTGHITVFGDPSVETFAVRSFQTLRRLMDGQTVPQRTEVPISVHKLSPTSAATESPSQDPSRSSN